MNGWNGGGFGGGFGGGGGDRFGGLRPDGTRAPERKIDPRTLRRIVASFHPYRWKVVVVLVAIICSTLLLLVSSLLIKRVFDDAIGHRDPAKLVLYTTIMLLAPVAGNLLNFGQSILNMQIGQNVMRDFRTRLFTQMQRMPLRFFTGTRAGEIQSRITNDVGGVQRVLTETGTQVVSNLMTVISSVIAMVIISPILTFISLGLLPFFLIVTYRAGKVRRALNRERQKSLAALSSVIHETLSISGALLIKTFGRQDYAREHFERHNESLVDLERRQQLVGRRNFLFFNTVFSSIPALIYLIGGWQLIHGSTFLGSVMTAGTLVAFTSLQGRLFGPASQLLNVQADIMAALALFDRIFEYLDLPVEIQDRPGARPLVAAQITGQITFNNVTFSYKRGAYDPPDANTKADEAKRLHPPSLRNVSFSVAPGQVAALVGPSGAGKSSIAQLLPRLYDVTSGSIQIDGHDVRDVTMHSLSELIGMVSQDTFLFHASIRENLRYARPSATEAEMIAAAKAAAIHDRIMECDAGYDTVVGERGHKFSGGEKQRLAIARVILKDPKILILDEATSALDTRSERLVQQALETVMRGRTSLVIAHRLSTIVSADVILVMDRGVVVERGTHAELLANGGLYARLYQQQFGLEEVAREELAAAVPLA